MGIWPLECYLRQDGKSGESSGERGEPGPGLTLAFRAYANGEAFKTINSLTVLSGRLLLVLVPLSSEKLLDGVLRVEKWTGYGVLGSTALKVSSHAHLQLLIAVKAF